MMDEFNRFTWHLGCALCLVVGLGCGQKDELQQPTQGSEKVQEQIPEIVPLAPLPVILPIETDDYSSSPKPARTGNRDDDEGCNASPDPICQFSGQNERVIDLLAYILETELKK